MIGYYILVIVIGYLCGCLESGYLVGKLCGMDIRDYGSGNAGTTNVLRVLGKSRALLTFLGDALKSFIPVLIVKLVLCPAVPELNADLIQLVTGFAAVMGHDYPFFLKFKGGKGVATTAAAMMAYDWRMGLCSFVIFVIVVSLTRYVSLGSILLCGALVIEIFIFHPGRWDLFVMCVLFAYFSIYRHRANIGRLISGTESKLGQKVKIDKKEEDQESDTDAQ